MAISFPKKDGRVRWISDFRKRNEQIRRKVYNLPKIQDILTQRSGYSHFTKLDISMQYYTFELDEASKEVCTICTPFGNYRYNRLPMGVSQAPDISQEIMEDLCRNFNEVDVYIDDVGVFSKDWTTHCASLSTVLNVLETNEFTVNPAKCEWAVQETDWLGYWLTPVGLKPWKKKIAAILALKRPETVKQLRSFISMVNFCRDMFPQHSHILALLTALATGKGPIPWSSECQQAFDTMKALLAKDAFLWYLDHNKRFDIYCDASDLQLGATILQEGMLVAFYSRKLNSVQRNYTVGEKELLSIVETLKEFCTMLDGCPNIHIYTDHKNMIERLQTQRVLRWRLFLDDYSVKFHYIKGNSNSLADVLP
jgi:RNase H-like domain found in reverse transcriptase/Reverse transcriptase (RNA-dependent DNA polymerase)